MEQGAKERYEFIDLLKAIAIFLVVMGHNSNLKTNFLEEESLFTYFNYLTRTLLCVCVPTFFFVNGALLFNKDFNLKKHIRKIISIIILTVIWGAITLLVLMPIKGEYMSFIEFAKSLWYWKIDWINYLWFMQALVIIYIFFPLMKIAYEKEINILYFFLAAAFIMSFGNVFLSNCANIFEFVIGKNYIESNFNFFNNFNAFSYIYGYAIVYFILGGLFLKHKDKFYEKKWEGIAYATIAISIILLTLYGVLMTKCNGEMYDIIWNGFEMIPTLCMVIAIYVLSLRYKGKNKFSKLITLISKNSFGIYFVHWSWSFLLIKFIKEIPYSDNFIAALLYALFTLLLSLLTVLLLKKIPIAKKLFFA
jgi:surface polysaccharide O-acyltransferase-like enzyme